MPLLVVDLECGQRDLLGGGVHVSEGGEHRVQRVGLWASRRKAFRCRTAFSSCLPLRLASTLLRGKEKAPSREQNEMSSPRRVVFP